MTICRYLEVAKRYNYTTAKSYLELIALFKSLLASKRAQLGANKARLQSGVEKISQASAQVSLFLQAAMTGILARHTETLKVVKKAAFYEHCQIVLFLSIVHAQDSVCAMDGLVAVIYGKLSTCLTC